MRKIILLLIFLFLPLEKIYCNSFIEFRSKNSSDFKNYSDTIEKDFENYQEELKKAFEDYKKKISKVWGNKNVIISGQKIYVSYFNKLRERSIIDFENGIVKLEFIISVKEFNKETFEQRIIDSIANSICQKPDTRSIIEISHDPDTKQDQRSELILKGQVKDNKGDIITSKNAVFFASQILKQKKLESTAVKNQETQDNLLISIDFPLADDHIKKRALKYVDIVIPESKNRNLEHELIFALIETESSFNPYAKSPVPAFGLMQLVPITAGRDAFRLVHKKDIVPTDKFLYNPKNNIVLGCAYLYILFNKYLDEIDDIESRKWCVIAAYNTGIGNIFEAFAGKFSKHRYNSRQIWKLAAFEKINQMSSSQVFNYLSENLKYSETRAYIEKVRSRIPKYKTGS
jgi:membrane-bound lytic murein transglycosylase C